MPAGIVVPAFSATLTTMTFDHSSSRWLGISDLIAEPEGPLLHLSYRCAPPFGPAVTINARGFGTVGSLCRFEQSDGAIPRMVNLNPSEVLTVPSTQNIVLVSVVGFLVMVSALA